MVVGNGIYVSCAYALRGTKLKKSAIAYRCRTRPLRATSVQACAQGGRFFFCQPGVDAARRGFRPR